MLVLVFAHFQTFIFQISVKQSKYPLQNDIDIFANKIVFLYCVIYKIMTVKFN